MDAQREAEGCRIAEASRHFHRLATHCHTPLRVLLLTEGDCQPSQGTRAQGAISARQPRQYFPEQLAQELVGETCGTLNEAEIPEPAVTESSLGKELR